MAQNTRGLYESNLGTKLTLNHIVLFMRKIMQNGLIDIKLDIYCTLHNRETLIHLFHSRLVIEAHKGQPFHVTAMG